MKIYLTMIEDTHADPEHHAYTNKDAAMLHAMLAIGRAQEHYHSQVTDSGSGAGYVNYWYIEDCCSVYVKELEVHEHCEQH